MTHVKGSPVNVGHRNLCTSLPILDIGNSKFKDEARDVITGGRECSNEPRGNSSSSPLSDIEAKLNIKISGEHLFSKLRF
jgi:hypothetical protein